MSKKFTIAFQLTNFLEEYPRLLLAGATDAAKELDVNLFVFQTEAFDIPFDYRYQSNLLFEFLNDREFDFLILSSSSLLNFISASEFEEKIKKLQGKNIISLGIPLKNAYAIVVENRKATFEATTHLIEVHRKRKIGFIKGSESNIEANERFKGYVEALERHGMELDNEIIFQGNFLKESGERVAGIILNKLVGKIDAIVCANDNMALGLTRKLKESGIKIPEDIAVIGFDDTPYARAFFPQLSTVRQPLYKQGYLAVKMAADILMNEAYPSITELPTLFIPRASCGCSFENKSKNFQISEEAFYREIKKILEIEDINFYLSNEVFSFFQRIFSLTKDEKNPGEKIQEEISHKLVSLISKFIESKKNFYFLGEIFELLRKKQNIDENFIAECKILVLKSENLFCKEFFEEANYLDIKLKNIFTAISSSLNWEEWLEKMFESFYNLPFDFLFLFRFETPVFHRKGEPFNILDIGKKLIMGFDKKRNLFIKTMEGITIERDSFLHEICMRENFFNLCVFLVYFMDYIYGYLVIDYDVSKIMYIEDIAKTIGENFFKLIIIDSLSKEMGEIKKRHEEIERELAFAELLQKNIIPSRPPFQNIAFFSKFKEKVGGDFFDFISFRERDWIGILVADVSGHGIPTAIITSILKSSILQLRNSIVNPSEFLMNLNDTIYSMCREGFFVTAFYGIIKQNEKKLVFSVAGHNLPYAITSKEVFLIKSELSSMPLGVLTSEELKSSGKDYRNEEFLLDNTKKLIFYTDGLVDISSKYNPQTTFEDYLLKSLFLRLKDKNPEDFVENVKNSIISFHGSEDFEDDITFICVDLV